MHPVIVPTAGFFFQAALPELPSDSQVTMCEGIAAVPYLHTPIVGNRTFFVFLALSAYNGWKR